MISDLLKVLDLVIQALTGKMFEPVKRKRLAKRLLRIQQSLAIVIEQGHDIVTTEPTESSITYQIPLKKLERQQTAIAVLLEELTDEQTLGVLNLGVPEFKEASACLYKKGHVIAAWMTLGSIYDEAHKALSELPGDTWKMLPARPVEAASVKGKAAALRRSTVYEMVARLQESMENMEGNFDLYGVISLKARAAVGLAEHDNLEYVWILATPEHVAKAKEMLRRLAESHDRLRKLLLENFKLDEFV